MRNQFKVLSAAVGTALVVGALAVGSVGAQTPTTSAPWSMREAVHAKVAAALGVPEAKLESALTQARSQALDDAVKAGQLTQQQADWMKQRQAAMQQGGYGPGMMGGRGMMGGGRVGGGFGPPWAAPAATR
jgi:hypothetical protein